MSKLLQCPKLSANPEASDFNFFKRQLENYFAVTKAPDDAKLPVLLNAVGRDGLDVYDGLEDP